MQMPPDPTNATLKRIYPWENYDITMVMKWLFAQAQKTGFTGDFNDFKLRYGAYVEATDPEDMQNLIEQYQGTYQITPLVSIEQVLKTKNKVLNQDIIIKPIPDSVINTYSHYSGRYQVTPMADVDQLLRTKERVMDEDMVIEKIPYIEVSNTAGGTTVIIG